MKFEKKEAALKIQEQPRSINGIRAEIVKIICVSVAKGDGTENNPVRTVKQYWTLEGDLIAENDPIH